MLGIEPEDTGFDDEIILYINGALMIMNELGVGPKEGFVVTDNTQTWHDFIGDGIDLELVKTDVYLRVRLVFDPPQNSFLVSNMQDQIKEYDWRIEVQRDAELTEIARASIANKAYALAQRAMREEEN